VYSGTRGVLNKDAVTKIGVNTLSRLNTIREDDKWAGKHYFALCTVTRDKNKTD